MNKRYITGSMILLAGVAQATDWTGTDGANWSDTGNWNTANVPDSNTETARFLQSANQVNVDAGTYTVNQIIDGFAGGGSAGAVISGPGTLEIDVNVGGTSDGVGFAVNTGGAGAALTFDGNVSINNTGGSTGSTTASFGNGVNSLVFGQNSTLTLNSKMKTTNGSAAAAGSTFELNGALAGSQNLLIASNNVSFGSTADHSAWTGTLVFQAGAKVVSDISNAKLGGLQLNGSGELVLDGVNNQMGYINAGGANVLTMDVNANQDSLGWVNFDAGGLLIDLDAAVTELAFADSSSRAWGTGSITIAGFQSGVIRFGTDANGLTAGQLAKIDGGAYSLDGDGYLVIPEPGTFALIGGLLAFSTVMIRRRK